MTDTSTEAVERFGDDVMALTVLTRLHGEACFEQGDHPDDVDTAFSIGAEAIIRLRALAAERDVNAKALRAAAKEREQLLKEVRRLRAVAEDQDALRGAFGSLP